MGQTSGWFFLTLFRYRNVWANFDHSHMLYVSCSHRFLHHSLQVFWATKHCKSVGLHPEPPETSLFWGGLPRSRGLSPWPSAVPGLFVQSLDRFFCLHLAARPVAQPVLGAGMGHFSGLPWDTTFKPWENHDKPISTSKVRVPWIKCLGVWLEKLIFWGYGHPVWRHTLEPDPGRVDPRLCSQNKLPHSIPWCKPSFSPLNLP
jgi:hypothetical protein